MPFKDYYESLNWQQQEKVKQVISAGYLVHLIAGRRMVGAHTYNKLKQIDPQLTWETLRG